MKIVLGLLFAPIGLVLLDLYVALIFKIAHRILREVRKAAPWLS